MVANRFRIRLIAALPAILWMAGIFLMSSRSTIPQAPAVPVTLFAAAGHLVAYAILAVLIARALALDVQSLKRRMVISWVLATLYGVSDEFHQSFVPGRHASIGDVFIDASGAAIGLVLLYTISRYRTRNAVPA